MESSHDESFNDDILTDYINDTDINDYLVDDYLVDDDLINDLSDDATEYNEDFYENFAKEEPIPTNVISVPQMKLPLDIISELLLLVDIDTFIVLSICSKIIGNLCTKYAMAKNYSNFYDIRYKDMHKHAVNYIRWCIPEICNHIIYFSNPITGSQLNNIINHIGCARIIETYPNDLIINNLHLFRPLSDYTCIIYPYYCTKFHEFYNYKI